MPRENEIPSAFFIIASIYPASLFDFDLYEEFFKIQIMHSDFVATNGPQNFDFSLTKLVPHKNALINNKFPESTVFIKIMSRILY